MPSLVIEELALKIYNDSLAKVKETERYGIDPFTIIMIIAILVNVIRVIQECNKGKTTTLAGSERAEMLSTDVKFRAFNNSFLTRMRLRKIIKNHITKEQNKVYGDALLKTLLENGKTVREEQVSALLEYNKNV